MPSENKINLDQLGELWWRYGGYNVHTKDHAREREKEASKPPTLILTRLGLDLDTVGSREIAVGNGDHCQDLN